MNDGKEILRLSAVNKSFGSNQILYGIDFQVKEGQVHALMGSNGAGKSTLMKIIAGEYTKDSGTIELEGKEINFQNPGEAKRHGISVIHQELNLVPELTVAENVYLGKEFGFGPRKFIISRMQAVTKTKEIIEKYNIDLNPLSKVKTLTIGQQQLVEILKAVSEDSKVLIMDEPTAALSVGETKQLFSVIQSLKSKGIGIVYISHRLDEIQEICDYVTILRDGRKIDEGPIKDFNNEKIIESMVGMKIGQFFPPSNRKVGEVLLRLQRIEKKRILKNISLTLHGGEIVGIFGLVGAGQSELLKVLFGVDKIDKGEMYVKGKQVCIDSPIIAKKLGMAFVTENRKEEGLVLELGSDQNMALASMEKFSNGGIKNTSSIKKIANDYVKKLNIKLSSLKLPVKNLSGGNQQKVVIGKWLITGPDVILLSEPTRGIDVGAKSEIYHLLDKLTLEGKGILIASSDIDEILGLSDRILVMFQGEIVAEIKKSDANKELLMEYASGAHKK